MASSLGICNPKLGHASRFHLQDWIGLRYFWPETTLLRSVEVVTAIPLKLDPNLVTFATNHKNYTKAAKVSFFA